MIPLTEQPSLFKDHTLSQLHSGCILLKDNISQAKKNGRLLILLEAFEKNLRKVKGEIRSRSLKNESI